MNKPLQLERPKVGDLVLLEGRVTGIDKWGYHVDVLDGELTEVTNVYVQFGIRGDWTPTCSECGTKMARVRETFHCSNCGSSSGRS